MDILSYIRGFTQGIVIVELLVCIILLVVSTKQNEKDLKFTKQMIDIIETELSIKEDENNE